MKRTIIIIVVLLLFPSLVLAQSPPLKITITHSSTASGVLLITPNNDYLQIIDNTGQVLYQKVAGGSRFINFEMQPDGTLSYRRADGQHRYIENLDRNYQLIETVEAIGYSQIDSHEVIKFGPGHWLYFIYDNIEPYDLTAYGGHATATLVSTIVQEQQNGGVVFEWRDIDHLDISDSVRDLTTARVDPFHGNSIDVDTDGNLLVSLRGSSEVVKINRQTGDIIWRLGGKRNQFMANGELFALQHDARRLPNGNLTVFDNRLDSYSRAVEYEMNEAALMITQTWEITGPFAGCCGNVQRLSSGNTLINWGNAGAISETTPAGEIVWSAVISPAPGWSYRAFRQQFPAYHLRFPAIWR